MATVIRHRVESKRQPQAPPRLPKEVIEIAPREYMDRWGVRMLVVWSGAKTDPALRDLNPNILK